MLPSDLPPLRALLQGAPTRYLTVRPRGFELHAGDRLRPVIHARIIGYGSARTLYRQREAHCHSLDGLSPLLFLPLDCISPGCLGDVLPPVSR